jgi:hypothetical protein
MWSAAAKASKWVDAELRRRYARESARVDDKAIRLIPIMIDDTPLSVLVADY